MFHARKREIARALARVEFKLRLRSLTRARARVGGREGGGGIAFAFAGSRKTVPTVQERRHDALIAD